MTDTMPPPSDNGEGASIDSEYPCGCKVGFSDSLGAHGERCIEHQAKALLRGWVKPEPGCWIAFNYDGSAFVPFGDGDAGELAAHRYASGLSMSVKRAVFGDEKWMNR